MAADGARKYGAIMLAKGGGPEQLGLLGLMEWSMKGNINLARTSRIIRAAFLSSLPDKYPSAHSSSSHSLPLNNTQ